MSIDASAIRTERNAEAGRYLYRFEDGSEASLLFHERTPGTNAITYVEVPSRHREQGNGEILVRRAVDDARAAGKNVAPLCSFARRVFQAEPAWADLRA